MSMLVLTAVVLAEVALFPIIAALASRTLVRQEIQSLDSPVSGPILRHAGRVPRMRLALGIVLAGVALLPVSGVIASQVTGKLLLTAVALVSAAAFVAPRTIAPAARNDMAKSRTRIAAPAAAPSAVVVT